MRMIQADDEGMIKFRIMFDDSLEPSLTGGEYNCLLKVGRESSVFELECSGEARDKICEAIRKP